MSATATATTEVIEAGAASLLDRLRPISLDDLDAAAALQTRVDRKYILGVDELGELLAHLEGRLAVLEIDQRRHFGYESVYFDTPQLTSYLDAARGRRSRFKVRTRSYLDSRATMLEVKTRNARKLTVKRRQDHGFAERNHLDDQAHEFIDECVGRPGLGANLWPTLTTTYHRSTLLDLDDIARVTIDADVV